MGGGPHGEDGESTQAHGDLLEPGSRVGHYEIVELLGQGGMAAVYRARDQRLARDVALKSPLARFARDPRLQRRILQEARTAAQLQHSNIVPVYDVFEYDGRPWIAMQLVEGGSLADRLRSDGALPPAEAVSIAAAIADALAAAHERGVLHRDVKPGNVLITRQGVPLLADFGISSWVLDAADQHSPVGTAVTETDHGPLPAPPRICRRSRSRAARSTRAATSSPSARCSTRCALDGGPSAGEHASAVREAVERVDPPPLSKLNPKVPVALDRVVDRGARQGARGPLPDRTRVPAGPARAGAAAAGAAAGGDPGPRRDRRRRARGPRRAAERVESPAARDETLGPPTATHDLARPRVASRPLARRLAGRVRVGSCGQRRHLARRRAWRRTAAAHGRSSRRPQPRLVSGRARDRVRLGA